MTAEPKVVAITGASQGIGPGLVEGFLGRGYRVVANSRRIEPSASPDVLTMGLTGDFIVEAMWQWHQTLSLDPCGEFPTRGKFASKPASLPEVGQTSSSSSRDGLAEAATEEGQWRRLTRRSAHGLPEDD
jgi:NAD(P)-dependent dehydrogenase (short-subunit alcohol dehydrogenase family)